MIRRASRRTALKALLCGAAASAVPGLQGKLPDFHAASPDSEVEPDGRRTLARVAEDFRRKFDAPGLSVAISRDGHLAYQQDLVMTAWSPGKR
jgi:CubicO group peptidase (beta-lactamase class C family)